ncbi:MAG: MlaE family lipid ABC transporter permease subunit [Proteobacteria bacterium]|nr:MlaE family lipid ABC transporter permease subunit [Pseudomonadota bacterium]
MAPEVNKSASNRRDFAWRGAVRRLGWPLVETLFNIGLGTRFALTVLARSGLAWRRPRLVMLHLKHIGVYTLVIILVAGLFIGFVLGLQFYTLLERYGQQDLLSVGVALTLFRELGPVAAGLLFVGCACTSITAAIGLKKASEQIAAMEVMAVDPLARELAPRLLAGMIALPLLTVYFDIVGVLGSYLITVQQIGLDEGTFWAGIKGQVGFYEDFMQGIYKSIFFGFITVMIALYEGYFCVPTAEGVARATTRTVIKGSLAVLGANFVFTAFMVH